MRCLYVAPSDELRIADDPRLDATTERHKVDLVTTPCETRGNPLEVMDRDPALLGLVLEMYLGWVGRDRMAMAGAALRRGRRVWLYWPSERVVECVDRLRLKSYWHHWLLITVYGASRTFRNAVGEFHRVLRYEWRAAADRRSGGSSWRIPFDALRAVILAATASLGPPQFTEEGLAHAAAARIADLDLWLREAEPVPLTERVAQCCRKGHIPGCGVALRMDFWTERAPSQDAGTSELAQSLASVTERMVSFVPAGSQAGDRGIQEVALDPPHQDGFENPLVTASAHYCRTVTLALEALRPSFICERLCLGNYAGALLSRSLKIPYIVAYEGSELTTRLRFDGGRYIYEDEYAKAEMLAFAQATAIAVPSVEVKCDLIERGIDPARIVVLSGEQQGARLCAFLGGAAGGDGPGEPLVPCPDRRQSTGDSYKDQTRRQWDNDPAGSQHAAAAAPHTADWFREVASHRYGEYAPWMPATMEFDRYAGRRVLELGGGMGTDLAQFARHGAIVTDLDLSSGHLNLAREHFRLLNLPGEFILQDAERLPLPDESYDLVYSNGVLHHTPNTNQVVGEIRRVLKPGGRAIVMVYAEHSLHYWRNLVWRIGLTQQQLIMHSMGEIMSRAVERSDNAAARPLVKVYTAAGLRALFSGFDQIEIVQRQLVAAEKPWLLAPVPTATLGALMGWNLIIKANKSL